MSRILIKKSVFLVGAAIALTAFLLVAHYRRSETPRSGRTGGKTIFSEACSAWIVSLTLPSSQILHLLGAEKSVVGIDRYSRETAPEFHNKEVISQNAVFSLEKILHLDPDLVIVWWYQEQLIESLQRFGINHLTYHPQKIEDVFLLAERLGRFLGCEYRARRLVEELKDRLDGIRVSSTGQTPLVYFELNTPFKTAGPGTFTDQIIKISGGRNLGALFKMDYPLISAEQIIKSDPDIIIFTGVSGSREDIIGRPGWTGIKAVRNGKVFRIPNELITPGPKAVEGVELISRIISDWSQDAIP
ncbi:MAG: ABC transporter substrate-binding protein [Candidatus Omnitrophota bacterium]